MKPLPEPYASRVQKRHDNLYAWLKEEHLETFEEQKHLDGGTPERAYWHHGYMMALRDTTALDAKAEELEKDG